MPEDQGKSSSTEAAEAALVMAVVVAVVVVVVLSISDLMWEQATDLQVFQEMARSFAMKVGELLAEPLVLLGT